MKHSFLKGALILVLANFVVKFIGMVYKIPLTNLIGGYGMDFFTTAYEVYLLLIAFSTAGLPVAVSKMVSESHALGRYSEINKIVKISMLTFGTLGIVGTFVMFFGAQAFANMANSPLTVYSIIALSPAVVFFSFVAILRGYFQGLQNMKPTAFTQVIEALTKVIVGILLAVITLNLGFGVEFASAAAIFGITISIVVASLLMFIIYKSKLNRIKMQRFKDLGGKCRSNKRIVRDLIIIAVPVTLGAFVVNLTGFLDLFLIKTRLEHIGLTMFEAGTLNGVYKGYAHLVYNLPISIMATINVTIVPIIAGAYALKDYKKFEEIVNKAIKVVVLLAMPCSAALFVVPEPILLMLFPSKPEDVAIAVPLLKMLSFAVLFTGLSSMLTAILQAAGKVNLPIFSVLIGGIVKLTCNYFLIGNENIGILGAPISTNLCYIVILTMNLYFVKKHTNTKITFISSFAKPFLASAIMGVIAHYLFVFFVGIVSSNIALIITTLISAFAYLILVFVTGGVTQSDLALIPGGSKLKKFTRK